MERFSGEEIVNVGSGEDVSIAELTGMVAAAVGYDGGFHYAVEKPDGMPRKGLDASRCLALGCRARTSLRDGLERTCAWWNAQQPAWSRLPGLLVACRAGPNRRRRSWLGTAMTTAAILHP